MFGVSFSAVHQLGFLPESILKVTCQMVLVSLTGSVNERLWLVSRTWKLELGGASRVRQTGPLPQPGYEPTAGSY